MSCVGHGDEPMHVFASKVLILVLPEAGEDFPIFMTFKNLSLKAVEILLGSMLQKLLKQPYFFFDLLQLHHNPISMLFYIPLPLL